MKITYGMIDTLYTVGNRSRHSYGIAVYAAHDSDDSTTVLCSVHDIASEPAPLLELVRKCNRLKLSPVHLTEVVEDFMVE